MADIFLELPEELMVAIERKASSLGKDTEQFVREIIEANAPKVDRFGGSQEMSLEEEPVVKAAEIEIVCRDLGYQYGWRFITCPQANASRANLLLISLNPAGRAIHGPSWSQEEGSAYRVESWNGLPVGTSGLQRQVQSMFELLGLDDDDVFSAHYVPFRSPSWAELDRKTEAEAFARRLWLWMRPKLSFERIICIGKDKPGKPIADLFGASLECSMPTGWGEIGADRYRMPDGRPLIALPHLSRFAIFGRPQGKDHLGRLFEL
jgi:hypothetical protein